MIKCYSKNGKDDDVSDYLAELIKKNKEMGIKALIEILNLPNKYELFNDIKVMKSGKYKFYELRVKSKTNICRFFFIVENPDFIVLLGFTKKTQKTEKNHLDKVKDIIEDYKLNKITVNFKFDNI